MSIRTARLALGTLAVALAASACTSHGTAAAPAPAATTPAATPPAVVRLPFATVEDSMRYLADAYTRDDRPALALVASDALRTDLYGAVRPAPHGSLSLTACAGSACTFVWTRPDEGPQTVHIVVERSATTGWFATSVAG
jgi:hypothetical protein